MSASNIVLLVLGILAANALVWVVILMALSKRMKQLRAELRTKVAEDEKLLIDPESGAYRGATARFGKVKGLSAFALTDRRLLWTKIMGAFQEVPLSDITELSENKWFLRSYNSRLHIILTLRDGTKLGFQVRDHARWLKLMRERTAAP